MHRHGEAAAAVGLQKQGYIADVPTGTSVYICSWRRCGCYKVMIFRPGDQDGEGAGTFERVIPEICLQQSS